MPSRVARALSGRARLVSVPPARLIQIVPTSPGRGVLRKAGLVVRAGAPPVTVSVPTAWRSRTAITWGNSTGIVSACDSLVSGAANGGTPMQAGSIPLAPACVPLVSGVGRSRVVRSPAAPAPDPFAALARPDVDAASRFACGRSPPAPRREVQPDRALRRSPPVPHTARRPGRGHAWVAQVQCERQLRERWPRRDAARSRSESFQGLVGDQVGRERVTLRRARAFGMPSRYLSVSIPARAARSRCSDASSRETSAAPPRPAVQHRVRRRWMRRRVPSRGQERGRLAVFSAE